MTRSLETQSERVLLDKSGRIVVPVRFRKHLGLEPGDPVSITLKGNEITVSTIQAALLSARNLMREKNTAKRKLSDELIAERRKEANRE